MAENLLAFCAGLAGNFFALVTHFLEEDLPELVRLSRRSLASAPWPASTENLRQLSGDDWCRLAPMLCAIATAATCIAAVCWRVGRVVRQALRPGNAFGTGRLTPASTPAGVALGRGGTSSEEASPLKTSYWLTRVLLLRGMGIIYLTAFLTSASQSRPLFGSTGLNPSTGKLSARPTPAFDAMEFIFLMPRADVALETVSWVGTLLSLLLAAGPDACVLWSGLPALLWAM